MQLLEKIFVRSTRSSLLSGVNFFQFRHTATNQRKLPLGATDPKNITLTTYHKPTGLIYDFCRNCGASIMKALGVLTMVFQLVFGFSGLQNVGADQADEDYKKGLGY
jgi:hypothetical protein